MRDEEAPDGEEDDAGVVGDPEDVVVAGVTGVVTFDGGTMARRALSSVGFGCRVSLSWAGPVRGFSVGSA